jgi:hypothetical protein
MRVGIEVEILGPQMTRAQDDSLKKNKEREKCHVLVANRFQCPRE